MNNGPEYYSSAAFYRDQRGFSNSSLSDASGISRTTIIKICAGELTPGVENQQKLADALHIDTEDLIFCSDSETVKKSVIDMEELTASILTAFCALPPHTQRKKADNLSVYLFMNDAALDACIHYWFLDANILGRSYPLMALSLNQTKKPSIQQPEVSIYPTALEAYRVQRNISKSVLGKKAYIDRHVVSQLCNGTKKPSQEQLRALARVLEVDYVDLERDLAPDAPTATPIVDMEHEKAKILQAIACCKPRRLKDSLEVILAYLGDSEDDTDALFGCLLDPASPNKETVFKVLEMLKTQLWSYSDPSLYEPKIEVGYCRSEWEDNIYDLYVLFDDHIYSLFNLESPLSRISYLECEEFSDLPQCGMSFPISFYTDLTPEDDEFESELLDQIWQFLMDETQDLPPGLSRIFFAYLEDNLWKAQIIEYTTKDLDLTLPFRLCSREQLYDRIFFEIQASSENYFQFRKDIVKIFCRMREDPEYELQMSKKYGGAKT